MAWYRLTVETKHVGCDSYEDFEVPDDVLAAIGEHQRDEIINDYAIDVLANLISWGYLPIDPPVNSTS